MADETRKDASFDSTEQSVARDEGTDAAAEDRERSFSRRALLHAGWTVPVIMAVAPPRLFAQSGHGDHTDGSHADHSDTVHSDTG